MYRRFVILLSANFIITTLLYLGFLFFNDDIPLGYLLFDISAVVSTSASIYLIFYLLLLPLLWVRRFILPLAAVLFVMVDVALIADFFIYRIWKFHINAMVLNIIFSPAAMDSIQAGMMPVLFFLGSIAGLSALQYGLIKRTMSVQKRASEEYNRIFLQHVIPVMLVIILADKGIYGYANMYQYTALMETTKPIPLYQPMDYTGTAEKLFNVKAPKKNEVRFQISENATVTYPNEPLRYGLGARPHIFIIAFDSTREDVIRPEITPNVWKLSQEGWRYTHNISGGNTTRFGIFGLFYGINSSLWFTFLNAQERPVFFDVLSHLGYRSHIFSSTDTSWPEFRQTVYFNIDGNISDTYQGKPWEKDRQSSKDFIDWLKEANASQPLFSFVFLDAPHGHSYPKSATKFTPDANGEVNFVTVSESDREVLFNQYKNANVYDDALFGEMIDAIKAKGIYDNSIIVFTSDHGDEFFEYGRFGHNSAYNKAQTNAPLVIKWPQNDAKVIDTMSSSLDLAPTLLHYLGVTNDPATYSHGRNLRDPNYHRDYAYVGNWNDNAIITSDLTYIYSNLQLFSSEVRDNVSYEKTEQAHEGIDSILLEVLQQNRQFVK